MFGLTVPLPPPPLSGAEGLPSSFLPQALEPPAPLRDSFAANNLNSYQSARPLNELNIPVKQGLTAAEYETMPDILPLKPHSHHKGMRGQSPWEHLPVNQRRRSKLMFDERFQ